MFRLVRDVHKCIGLKSCGKCVDFLPPLARGDMDIASWARWHNAYLIDLACESCPVDALEIKEL